MGVTVDDEVQTGHLGIDVGGAVADALVVDAEVEQTDDDVGARGLDLIDELLRAGIELLGLLEGEALDQAGVDLGVGFGGLETDEADLDALLL